MRPVIQTQITHHTIWQAVTGTTPPLALPPLPIPKAVCDNRDVDAGDLFVALVGENADGHKYIAASLRRGARVILCEARGQEDAATNGAIIVDCTAPQHTLANELTAHISTQHISTQHVNKPESDQSAIVLAYIVEDAQAALQALGAFQRLHRVQPDLCVIGITGSVGKSSSKELIASVLRQRFATLHSPGNLNNEQGVPFTLLGLGLEHERAVLEMGTYSPGEIHDICTWARPHIGVVTNIGPVHLERMGTLARITTAKAELVAALPAADEGGVAILNWDDERVRTMVDKTRAHVFRYGLTPDADLLADEIASEGLKGIRFCFHYQPPKGLPVSQEAAQAIHVRMPLLGRHSVHTALCAAAVGLVEKLSWAEIVNGIQRSTTHIRLVAVAGVNGSTVIDDTYNASPASMIAALNLLADIQPDGVGRRVAVLGDMRELGTYTDEGHKLVGRRAASTVDMLVTVGELGRAIGTEALQVGFPDGQLFAFDNAQEAIDLIQEVVQSADLILVKGSRAVGMDDVVAQISAAQNKSYAEQGHR